MKMPFRVRAYKDKGHDLWCVEVNWTPHIGDDSDWEPFCFVEGSRGLAESDAARLNLAWKRGREYARDYAGNPAYGAT